VGGPQPSPRELRYHFQETGDDALTGGILLTRISTRSAVSRSVSRVATAARSVSRRASRSLTFVFSTLIWSNIVGVVVGMVAFSGFRSIGIINLAGV